MRKTTLFLITVFGAISLFLLWDPGKHQPPQTRSAIASNSASLAIVGPAPRPVIHPPIAVPPDVPSPGNEDAEPASPFTLSREKIEAFLAAHHRDAASLLAAFHAASNPLSGSPLAATATNDLMRPSSDPGYLREAATNFPDDPRVQIAVLDQNTFPDDRRKWLDAFKDSSPSNSLANYLSAREYFQNNQNAAVAELLAASAKPQFEDYQIASLLTQEEMYLAGGKSEFAAFQASMAGVASETLPELANLKAVSQGLAALQKQYSAAGDDPSLQNLTQMGLGLSDRLTTGSSGKLLINQLTGIAIEATMLAGLDQNTGYAFLNGETPAQRSVALKEQRAEMRDLARESSTIILGLSESDQKALFERAKVEGELTALRWLHQQHGPPPAN